MVLAIIGIMAGLLAGNAGAFLETAKEEPVDRILRKAVLDATYLASQTKQITYLRHDDQNGTLVIENAAGSRLSLHRITEVSEKENFIRDDEKFSLVFEAEVPLSGINGDDGDWQDEETMLSRVAFHPSGVSTPFRALLRTGMGNNEEKLFRFDPFSGYPRLALDIEK